MSEEEIKKMFVEDERKIKEIFDEYKELLEEIKEEKDKKEKDRLVKTICETEKKINNRLSELLQQDNGNLNILLALYLKINKDKLIENLEKVGNDDANTIKRVGAANYWLGYIYYFYKVERNKDNKENDDIAIEYFKKSYEKNNNNAKEILTTIIEQGDSQKIETIITGINLDGFTSIKCLYNLAMYYCKKGDKKAEKYFEKVKSASPIGKEEQEIFLKAKINYLCLLYKEEKRKDDALNLFKDIFEKNPKGLEKIQDDNFLEIVEKVIEQDKFTNYSKVKANAQYFIGKYYLNLMSFEKAFNYFDNASNENYNAKYELSRCYVYEYGVEKNLEKANEYLEALLKEAETDKKAKIDDDLLEKINKLKKIIRVMKIN